MIMEQISQRQPTWTPATLQLLLLLLYNYTLCNMTLVYVVLWAIALVGKSHLWWVNLRHKQLNASDQTFQSKQRGDTFQIRSNGVVPA